MSWSSTTRVVRISRDARDAAWAQVCTSKPPAAPSPQPIELPVCCYFLQGTCYFGAEGCEYSHDLSRKQVLGCQFGPKCHLGHMPVRLEVATAPVDLEFVEKARVRGGLDVLECCGPSLDDTDPVWEELACVLCDEGEEVGDGDLPIPTRERLAALGQYQLVDEDIADEWLCLPADTLRDRLESAREGVARLRHRWLGDDAREAKWLWGAVAGHIKARPDVDAAVLQREVDSATEAVQKALALVPRDTDKGTVGLPWDRLTRSFAAAAEAAASLERVAVAQEETPAGPEEAPGEQPDLELQSKLHELTGCLERCAGVSRAQESELSNSRGRATTDDAQGEKRSRSRSPRQRDAARSLSEMAQAAAMRGEFILVHHSVGLYGEVEGAA